ncbi:MAG: energy-converting hydrogenase A, subunit K [Methanobrevibacter sp.]|jgi:energy-converting hydrogenase A subunit K|nr:energy-converting hydrogenase A, subunit K [Candidatus Methanovirga meridionalis]
MNKEKDLIILTSLVAIGVFILGAVVSLLQSMQILPILILGIIFLALILLQIYPKFNHITENLEKIVFFIVLFLIIISFIYLYKPI